MSGVLGDYVTLQRGNTYKSALLGRPGPVLLGLASIARNGGFRDDNLKTYGGQCDSRMLLKPGDLYVSLKDVTQAADLLGAVARVPPHISQGRLTQDTVRLTPTATGIPADYIYWLLRTPEYRAYCRAHSTGTTNLGLSRDDFLSFRVPALTSLRESIVTGLQRLDDKIELNRRTNETLEAMAQAIFRDWFIDFGPVRRKIEGATDPVAIMGGVTTDPVRADEIATLVPQSFGVDGLPSGWEFKRLEEITSELRRGLAPKYIESEGVRVLNQKCIRNRQVSFGPARRHDPAQRSVAGREIAPGDVLVNSTGVGTLGRVAQIWDLDETTVVDSHVTVVRADPRLVPASYLGVALCSREPELEALGEGSTGQTELSRSRLAALELVIPGRDFLAAFDTLVRPLIDLAESNRAQEQTLAETRDYLLPRLMSGEVRVWEAEAQKQAAE